MKPIVVINKVDRPSSRVEEVESEIFDLFCNLDANDDQLEYPTIYAAARDGWAVKDLTSKREGVIDLLDCVAETIPPPNVDITDEFRMLITQTESNQYFGRQLIGRIASGTLKTGDKMCTVN